MEKTVKESLDDVLQAMTRLNGNFEDKIKEFRLQGHDESDLLELTKGAQAMKDSAGLYITWSRHYIERLEKAEGLDLDEVSEGIGGRSV